VSIAELLITIAALLFLGMIVIVANYADRDHNKRLVRVLMITIILINGAIVLLYGLMQVAMAYSGAADDPDVPDKSAAWGALLSTLVLAGVTTAILHRPVRVALASFFLRPRSQTEELHDLTTYLPSKQRSLEETEIGLSQSSESLFPQMLDYYTADLVMLLRPSATPAKRKRPFGKTADENGHGFDALSYVHLTALVFCLYLLGIQFVNFLLGSGLEGVAESYEEDGLSVSSVIVNGLPLVIIPVLGIGGGIRRNWRQVLKRLGLGMPDVEGVVVSVFLTFGLFFFVAISQMIWLGLVSEETFDEQTQAAEALSESISTLELAFLVAVVAAVSEEIAFRGALQPVFGFWPTAIFFALTHAQYAFTPAVLIILGVAVGFGWLRQRYNTTVAILAHFTYDFIPLAIAVSLPEEAVSRIGAWLRYL
jgi:membrane protease YdiL (CAAX protease family)